MIIKMIEIYNIAAQSYYCRWTHVYYIETIAPHTPHLHIYRLKENTSLPAMLNPLFSSTNQQLFKKNFCNQSSHYGWFP